MQNINSWCRFPLANKEHAKLCALRAKNVLTCQRTLSAYVPHMPSCLVCLRNYVSTCLASSRGRVPTCLESPASHG